MVETPQNRTKSAGCFLDNGPLISIVVPVYNMEKYLERCVDSILEQTYRNLEIILVDDCSSDTSATLIQKYVEQDDRIKVARHEVNRGLFQARITGSQIARGKYIAFVDSDDYVSIDWFRTLLKKAEAENADITVGEWCFDTDGKSRSYINLDPFRIQDYCLEGKDILKAFMEQEGTCFSWTVVWNKLYRMELWQKCLPDFIKFSEEHGHMLMWEDIAFSSGLWSNAQKVVNVHNVLYFYFKHEAASTSLNKNKKRNLKYSADSSAAINFMHQILYDAQKLDSVKTHFLNWRANAASMIYHELVIDMGVHRYEPVIRQAFNYQNTFGERNVFFYSINTELSDSFSWLEDIIKAVISPYTKYVSFDVFDTLIERPFAQPTDLFDILSDELNQETSSYIDFTELRINAERYCREKQRMLHPSIQEITIDQIYDTLAETTVIAPQRLQRLKARELELEIYFCGARKIGKTLYEFAQDAGKEIIICSDMYLPRDTIEVILQKSGYHEYKAIYLSSELLLTKASGRLYKYVQSDLNVRKTSEILHIGDNWDSDIQQAQKHGWQTAHVGKAIDILRNHNPGIYSGDGYKNIWNRAGSHEDYAETMRAFPGLRNVTGLIANRLYGNPFVSINMRSDFNADPRSIGYWGLGTHLLSLSEWILKIAKERNIPTIHFVARDGYLVKQAFDLLNDSNTISNYIRLSRKALILADITTKEDLYCLNHKINVLRVTPQQLTEYLRPIISCSNAEIKSIFQRNHIFIDREFGNIPEYQNCIKVLSDYVLDFSLLPAYHKKLSAYFSAIVHPGDYIFDVGYNGRPESALSNLLGFPVGSLYIHVNSEIAAKRQSKFHCPNECFYGNKPSITGVMREHLMMELGPSTTGYVEKKGTLEPVFEDYMEEYSSSLITRIVQNSALKFICDYVNIFGKFREQIILPLDALSAPFEYYLHYSKPIDRQIFATLPFEDDLGEGNSFGALDFWNQEIEKHNLNKTMDAIAGLPQELSDLYLDGLFVKFYKIMNKRFPKGSAGRAMLKRIAAIFM